MQKHDQHTQGPKLTFLGRRQLATEIWSPKSVNKIFRNTNQNFWPLDGKFWSPMFLLRIRTIFPLTNKIKYKHTYHSKTTTNELNAGHIRSFVRPLTVSSHFCTFLMCKHRFSMCKRITNKHRPLNIRIFIRVIHQA